MAATDGWVAQALDRTRAVPATAIAHARALQLRGFEHNDLAELLIDLGHARSDALAAVFARETGAALWDESAPDPGLYAQWRGGSAALPVRRIGRRVFYATTTPYDPVLRDSVRFACDATEAEPLVTSEWALQRARMTLVRHETEPGRSVEPVTASPEELQQQWERDAERGQASPLGDLACWLLLEHVVPVAGARLCIRCFDPPHLHYESPDGDVLPVSEGWSQLPAALWDPLSRRLQYMAGAHAASELVRGVLQLGIGMNGRTCAVFIDVTRTRRGRVVVLQRAAPVEGLLPTGPIFDGWRRAVRAYELALSADDVEGLEQAALASVAAAEALGEAGILELVVGLRQLADILLDTRREFAAREHLDRALELIDNWGLGPRVRSEILGKQAMSFVDDPDTSIALFAEAEHLIALPGPGTRSTAVLAANQSLAHNALGQSSEALAASERALAAERRWLGELSAIGVQALVDSAFALGALGEHDAALSRAQEAHRSAEALGLDPLPARWAQARIARFQGDPELALTELRTALTQSNPDAPSWHYVRAELALTLAELGQHAEAREIAREVLPTIGSYDALGTNTSQLLERVLHQAGAYR